MNATPAGEPVKLYLATPCYGGLANTVFVQSLLDLQGACQARGVELKVDLTGGDALITRARSRMLAHFLATDCSHMLFVDADIGFRPENVFRLLDAGHDVSAGVYPLKRIDWDKARAAAVAGASDLQAASVGYVVRFLPTPDNSVEVEDGFAEVAYAGTGFLMIRRAAARRLVDAHPELKARMDDMADAAAPEAVMVFETMIEPETGQYLSEDYAFCRRWRDLGGKIWADMQSRLTHVGYTAYSGSLVQAMTLRA
jgi:hypothetical protein